MVVLLCLVARSRREEQERPDRRRRGHREEQERPDRRRRGHREEPKRPDRRRRGRHEEQDRRRLISADKLQRQLSELSSDVDENPEPFEAHSPFAKRSVSGDL